MSDETTWNRAIINSKMEDLSEHRYLRLHLILGDSLMSQLGTFLKVGTMALLLRLLESGESLGDDLELLHPVKSLTDISRDPGSRRRIPMADGRLLTAVEIQRDYLSRAEAFLKFNDAPPWAKDVVEKWSYVLDHIENDPMSLDTMLDPYIKLSLFSKFLKKRGLTWEHLRSLAPRGRCNPASLEGLMGMYCRVTDPEDTLSDGEESVRRDKKPEPQEVRKVLQQLIELDIRYHDIRRDSSLFYLLERSGMLKHQVVSQEEITMAKTNPPVGTRAEVRGKTITSLVSKSINGVALWTAIWLPEDQKYLCIADPFAKQVEPKDMSKTGLTRSPSPALIRFLTDIGRRYL
jgi:proteasome accessory factor A